MKNRYYQLNFGMICPIDTTEEVLDKFEDEFIDLVEKYNFSVGSLKNFKPLGVGTYRS